MQIKEPVLVKEDFYDFVSREDYRACRTMQDRAGAPGLGQEEEGGVRGILVLNLY